MPGDRKGIFAEPIPEKREGQVGITGVDMFGRPFSTVGLDFGPVDTSQAEPARGPVAPPAHVIKEMMRNQSGATVQKKEISPDGDKSFESGFIKRNGKILDLSDPASLAQEYSDKEVNIILQMFDEVPDMEEDEVHFILDKIEGKREPVEMPPVFLEE